MTGPTDEEIPLFPLSSVLMPSGKMPLQIFERRYLDLVRDCMKSGSGFGVVWIREGVEVVGTSNSSLVLGDYGTYARIVDWDQLPNGLLGVTIEGQQLFTLASFHTLASGLVMGRARLGPPPQSTPLLPDWQHLADVLRGLETHPHVQRMGLDIDYNDAWQVAYMLLQLLPLDERLKYELLGADSLEALMAELNATLSEISG